MKVSTLCFCLAAICVFVSCERGYHPTCFELKLILEKDSSGAKHSDVVIRRLMSKFSLAETPSSRVEKRRAWNKDVFLSWDDGSDPMGTGFSRAYVCGQKNGNFEVWADIAVATAESITPLGAKAVATLQRGQGHVCESDCSFRNAKNPCKNPCDSQLSLPLDRQRLLIAAVPNSRAQKKAQAIQGR